MIRFLTPTLSHVPASVSYVRPLSCRPLPLQTMQLLQPPLPSSWTPSPPSNPLRAPLTWLVQGRRTLGSDFLPSLLISVTLKVTYCKIRMLSSSSNKFSLIVLESASVLRGLSGHIAPTYQIQQLAEKLEIEMPSWLHFSSLGWEGIVISRQDFESLCSIKRSEGVFWMACQISSIISDTSKVKIAFWDGTL